MAQRTNDESKQPASYSAQFVEAKNTPIYEIYKPVGNGQCVDFVKAHGYANLKGNALEWAKYINSNTPVVGGVVLLKESSWGHLALITGILGDNIYLVEQNYDGLYIISRRVITIDNPDILGFIK